jgi:hypothetical protein
LAYGVLYLRDNPTGATLVVGGKALALERFSSLIAENHSGLSAADVYA